MIYTIALLLAWMPQEVLEKPFVVDRDYAAIDFAGKEFRSPEADLAPDQFTRIAILIDGKKNVTLKNVKIRGFKVGIYARNCENLTITGADLGGNFRQKLDSTPDREATTDWLWPHFNDQNEWMEKYGANIYLENCTGAKVFGNRGQHSQNGIILDETSGSLIYDNDFSYNSGWGLALWRSSKNRVSHNKFDYCVRGYSHGVYHRGQDSAGILVFEQCRDNVFAYNSATHGGDGFFLYAGHETTKKTGEGGCNGNLIYANDFSHAVANGIEATFSSGNQFVGNILDECDYGIWAGYSSESLFADNMISRSLTAGIAIEHGSSNRIENNRFQENRKGIWLWWDEDPQFLNSIYGEKRDTDSHGYRITGNRFRGEETAIHLNRTAKTLIEGNEIREAETDILVEEDCPDLVVQGNNFIEIQKALATQAENYHSSLAEAASKKPFPLRFSFGKSGVKPPKKMGNYAAFLPVDARRGRETMMVDEWGPLDQNQIQLFPTRVDAWGEARIFLLGPGIPFAITKVSGGVTVVATSETLPTTLIVHPGPEGSYHPFEIEAEAGNRTFHAAGTILAAPWTVQTFTWEPAGAGKPPADWQAVLRSESLRREQVKELALTWGSGPAGEGLPQDYFATLARSEFEIPPGTYELISISDDGIRVRLDGEIVQEDWTWHAPRENRTTLEIGPGRHTLEVEHFEIDGFAQLGIKLVRKD